MADQMWTQQQRENTTKQLAQKMSHLTSRPLADLYKLATSLEDMAFTKAAGVQKEYLTILSKRMKKLEVQFTGQQTSQAPQASGLTSVAQQQYQQPSNMSQQQQQQLMLQLQQQQQLRQQQQLAAQQQQQQQQQMQMQMQMHQSQSQLQQQRAQAVQFPQQSIAMSTGSHEDDFANMADMFGLYNTASSAAASSQQTANQTYMPAQVQRQHQQQQQQQQQQHAALMPQIPRQAPNAEQLKQQQLFQQQQAQQRQLQLRQQQSQQQQAQQARQVQHQQQQQLLQQQQQQLRQQQQRQQQHAQYLQQLQQTAGGKAATQASQQALDGQSQADKDNQARMAQFWEVQGQIRQRYLPQLQALKDSPYMRSHHIVQANREYVLRALNVSMLRRDDAASLAAVGSLMSESKLASVRKMFVELDGGLKSVRAAIVKTQEEMARNASAQRAQSQTPPPSHLPANPQQGLASPAHLPRPSTPKAAAPPLGHESSDAETGFRPSSLLTELPLAPAAPPSSAPTATHPLPAASQAAQHPAAAPSGSIGQASQAQTNLASIKAETPAPQTTASDAHMHMQTKAEADQLPASPTQAAPSLISAVTQAADARVSAAPSMQSILDDGHVFMPAMPADLQAELASSASSSFNGIATFGTMHHQLSSTFDGSPVLAGDLAADLMSSPHFAVSDQDLNAATGGVAPASTEAAAAAAAASVAAVNAAVTGQAPPIINTAAFNAAAGAALSRSQTAPPVALLNLATPATPTTPTLLSTLASTSYAEDGGTDPSSPVSATTAHMGMLHQRKKVSFKAKEAHSSQSAPCLGGLGKRRASESNIATQMDVKRSRAHLAHVEAAIKQASETFKGMAHLEATDSLYSRDCIMLTCTPVADSATADSADTWQAITLRISSAYPNEAPSVVVRMSRDAQLAPQGEAVRSVLETSLSTLPFPPTLEAILRCWLSAVQSVGKVFSASALSASQVSLQASAVSQLSTGFSQPASFPMQSLLPSAAPAVISVGSLAPLPTPASAPFSALGASSATAATFFGGAATPQMSTGRQRSFQKQLSTGTQHSHAMLGSMQPGIPAASILPNTSATMVYPAPTPASNPMGSIESLVSAGLLPQGSGNASQHLSQTLPKASLGHLAALLDLPQSNGLASGMVMQASGPQ